MTIPQYVEENFKQLQQEVVIKVIQQIDKSFLAFFLQNIWDKYMLSAFCAHFWTLVGNCYRNCQRCHPLESLWKHLQNGGSILSTIKQYAWCSTMSIRKNHYSNINWAIYFATTKHKCQKQSLIFLNRSLHARFQLSI